ncbi:hypothetical protein NARC_160026 [Candidatus Nitrosocosmicus arcticus]|uniref:Uncharacterized protein n=1 Tax=Candidatus Nitrosocosmicus arcticus TaxID=2035267 RepID=A0A557SRS8_9ARCH|nr:hypothetical protein NARC_160026 [Candidatus Nitrosocosmicus arcticus]
MGRYRNIIILRRINIKINDDDIETSFLTLLKIFWSDKFTYMTFLINNEIENRCQQISKLFLQRTMKTWLRPLRNMLKGYE